jgi:hypothetical protein
MVLFVLHGVSSGRWRQFSKRLTISAKNSGMNEDFVGELKFLSGIKYSRRLFYRRKEMTRPEVSGNFFNWWETSSGLRTVGARLPAIEADEAP